MAAAFVVAAAALFVPRLLDGDDAMPRGGAPSVPAATADTGSCDYAKYEPTYLPWLAKNEAAPPPRRDKEDENAILLWEDDDDASGNPATVELVTELESTAQEVSEEGFPTVAARGQRGYLIWVGDPGVGQLVIVWQENQEPCESYALSLLDQDLHRAAAEAEIEKVLESLKRTR
ncbi:MAG TPA: hypothetical protein VIG64_06425 [Actinomycetota bacterium]